MNKTEFIYKSVSPSPYCCPQTNKVTVWTEGGKIHYKRQYINREGKESNPGISQTFEKGASVLEVAKMIHWGCSGTSFNSLQLRGLIEDITPVVKNIN